MNLVFFIIVIASFFVTCWRQITWVPMDGKTPPIEVLSNAILKSASDSVQLALGLIGVMALFLGLMKIAEEGGLLQILARLIRPLMVRLFPDVPEDHPAMGSMILNMAANALGLGNAATPFGIKAMQELDELNQEPGTATDAMALFLSINTSSVTLLPTGVIALRAAAGSHDPAGILPTTLFATACSTVAAIVSAKMFARFGRRHGQVRKEKNRESSRSKKIEGQGYPLWISVMAISFLVLLIPLTILYGKALSPWIIPGLVVMFLSYGMIKGVRIYEVFVEGAKDGFQVAVKIIPFLVAILVAVGMFRASGAMEAMVNVIGPFTSRFGLPAEALPMAFLRPLSGSGAYGILASIINDPSIGPDSYVGYLVSTLQGSTETTFYVIAVYFGAIQVRRMRYTLASALIADITGIGSAVFICSLLYG